MPKTAIKFFSQNTNYNISGKNKLRKWIENAAISENKPISELIYIICDDTYLLNLNETYLNHNTFTDVISFDMSDSNVNIKGEIYISIDRVRENSRKYGETIQDEFHRVMIHGMLHLAGYNDRTENERTEMRLKEDYYLSLR